MIDFQLIKVKYLPAELQPEILYVSKKFNVAGHLCACGCGNKVITPLGPTEWEFKEYDNKASLNPSIGNWQLPCKSHYWIKQNKVEWSYAWSDREIADGRKNEQRNVEEYFTSLQDKRRGLSLFERFIQWILGK